MNHSGWIMKWGVGYSSAPLEHLHGNKTLSKPSILSSDEANKPCVKQKAVSNPLLRTTQPTANRAGIYELLQYRKMPELLPVTYQVQPVWPFIKQGYLCGARKHVMKTSVHEAPDHHIDSSVVLISTPTKLCSSSFEFKHLSHHHRGLEALWQVWTQYRHAASWRLLYWAAPPWQRQSIGLVIDVLVNLECSCSFPVSKQPVLLKQAASNTSGHDREEMPEPLFLSIPTSFNEQI